MYFCYVLKQAGVTKSLKPKINKLLLFCYYNSMILYIYVSLENRQISTKTFRFDRENVFSSIF